MQDGILPHGLRPKDAVDANTCTANVGAANRQIADRVLGSLSMNAWMSAAFTSTAGSGPCALAATTASVTKQTAMMLRMACHFIGE